MNALDWVRNAVFTELIEETRPLRDADTPATAASAACEMTVDVIPADVH
jgi:hypothetical protein